MEPLLSFYYNDVLQKYYIVCVNKLLVFLLLLAVGSASRLPLAPTACASVVQVPMPLRRLSVLWCPGQDGRVPENCKKTTLVAKTIFFSFSHLIGYLCSLAVNQIGSLVEYRWLWSPPSACRHRFLSGSGSMRCYYFVTISGTSPVRESWSLVSAKFCEQLSPPNSGRIDSQRPAD